MQVSRRAGEKVGKWESEQVIAKIQYHWDLDVYRMSVDAAMQIFEISKAFPKEETYSLTDQIRRASRSVSANLAEGWRRRKYEKAFVNKLNEAEGEAAETQAMAGEAQNIMKTSISLSHFLTCLFFT